MNDVRRGGPWAERSPAGGAPQEPTPEASRGICFCLLYDLCCWLATVRRPVPEDVDEYTLTALRTVDDPLQRLGRYMNPALLQSWERALQPFFASGVTLEPELGEAGSFQERGRDAAGWLRAELRFANRSSVVDRSLHRHELPPRDWILSVLLSPELGGRVEDASIRRA